MFPPGLIPGLFLLFRKVKRGLVATQRRVYMKFFSASALVLLILISLPVAVNAEFVFKKDGAIIKGAIVADEMTSISVKNEAGTVERVDRKDIMRIIYTDLYLGKVYARLTTGEVIDGYQVDENRDNFFFRKELYKPEEITVSRRKVMFIARTNPTDLKGIPHGTSIDLSWSPPFKPAKHYKVFIRDVKKHEESFRLAAETSDLGYLIKGLNKSWSYEIYATAIADTGEESLPSEKIVVSTIPDAPEKVAIAENLSSDRKTVDLTFSWNDVADAESRVTSYAVYEIIGSEKKKKGTSTGGQFVLKDYPAEGRHWFAVVSVNDDFTESDDVKVVYDAGFRIPIRAAGTYLYPTGNMRDLASFGYGGLVDIGLSGRSLGIGVETGYVQFSCAADVKRMSMIPALLTVDYRFPLFSVFSLRPVIKAGGSYDMITYVVHDKADPLITRHKSTNSFDGLVSAGAYLQADIADKINLFGGAEYGTIFQKGGTMGFVSCSFGAGIIF